MLLPAIITGVWLAWRSWMSIYDERPWLARYDAGQPTDLGVEHQNALAMFRACVRLDPGAPMIRYFDGGLSRGGRVPRYLQNVPQFLIALVGTWKAGGIAVAINPMNRQRELEVILSDSGASVLVALEDLYQNIAAHVMPRTSVRQVVTTSALEYQTRNDRRILAD